MAKIFKIQTTDSSSDEMLVEKYKLNGNQEALATLFLRYSDLLYGVCLKYLEDEEEAKDAVMNIYHELLKKLPLHDVQNFKSWLYVLAKNHCLMQLRATKKNITVSFENQSVQSEAFLHLDNIMEKEETFRKLEKCLETLSEEQKLSVELFYYQHKCYNEIAAATGMDWNKVRSLIQNGRRNLKICMEKNVN
ncbi:MAG TPA: sigma-70 family RNA polymerase sigma factor [Niabella sp.]|nr:sigma-70 family RNA polymerase sigma factor [Chitinophagaceae bacterium]HRO84117.1 sigma-70 family RNA polymerase sigma factor [Niabella sp.]